MNKESQKINLRKTQAEERRLQILDAALRVFASKGFKGTSIKDIAKDAGISQGLMYHYFSSKRNLLEATVEYNSFLPQLRQILTGAGERPPDEVFKDIADGFLSMLDNKAMLIRIFLQEVESNPMIKNAWANLCREGVSLLQEYIQSQISRGELKQHNTEVSARCMFGMLFMYHFTRDLFQSSQVKKAEFIEESLTAILREESAVNNINEEKY